MFSVHLCVSQVTDYAIARRIVDLHSRIEESVDRLYSLDEIRRYLLFARQFKPKVRVRLRRLCVYIKLDNLRFVLNLAYSTCVPVDLQRIRRVHRGAVQASASARRLWRCNQVCLENNGATAGEHDPPFRGHGAHALL